jgi:hypothetical protein
LVLLRWLCFLPDPSSELQHHDLGKLLFAFSCFWGYLWLCQYLLVWYGNLPDEVTHYVTRTAAPWRVCFGLNFVVNWVVPSAALLSARAKRSSGRLVTISVLLLAGHWLDLYLLIALRDRSRRGWPPELSIATGYFALFYLTFLRSLSRAPWSR